ncbi:hypothetical protein [Planococcus lenghuensis]|uniref:Lipoprotein n=1 Tax=Planococcus lenghuensis TaxID=2213202 RepID=A0A1Q2KZ38_9BACL|nr:hypothetical protein [Planococcus lenghuensis]AQQ53468.1 hypothetical protein B0X71_10540 [Planococcus lenghuensis]
MKPSKIIIGVLSVSLVLSGCEAGIHENAEGSNEPAAAADWPAMTLEEMKTEADLIAFATVEDTITKETSSGIYAQIATLEVTEAISGTAPGKVELNQSTDFVEEGETYLLFLLKHVTDSYYYIVNYAGIIEEQNGLYSGGILEEDSLSKEEVKSFLSE